MKEQFLKNAQAQFLRDTIQFYNSVNVAVVGGGCVYRSTEKSPGCAIGRHIANKKRCAEFDTEGSFGEIVNWEDTQLIELGAPLCVLGREFLEVIQKLHDDFLSDNWCAQGITPRGRVNVEDICIQFGLDRLAVFSSQTHPAE